MKHYLKFIFFFFILLLVFGYMHELVHVAIFESDGIESRVEVFSHFPAMVTIAEQPCRTAECKLANNINEAIGYPLLILYSLIGIGFLALLRQNEDKIH